MTSHETPQARHDRLLALVPQDEEWVGFIYGDGAPILASHAGWRYTSGAAPSAWRNNGNLSALFQPVETWTEIDRHQLTINIDSETRVKITYLGGTWTGPRWGAQGQSFISDATCRFYVHPDDAPPTDPDEALADLLDSELGSVTNGREDYLKAARSVRAHIENENSP